MSADPFISLVIATYNRAELLPRTLAALLEQDATDTPYEVLFIDDGSTDGTREILAEAARTNPILRLIRVEHTGSPARPRNIGIGEARGHVIVLLDDDVVPDRSLVQAHADYHRRFAAPEDAALGELYLPEEVRRDPMSLFHSFPYNEARNGGVLSYLYFWTCNVSVKRTFLASHGLFDEDAALHPLEDMECGYRLALAGLKIRFLPSARGCHLHKMQPEWVWKKGVRTGRAQYALVKKVPDIEVKKRFGILSTAVPWPLLAWRLIKRAAFLVTDNRVTHAMLRGLGAERSERSRLTDLYYYLRFRRAMLVGFGEARREWIARQEGQGGSNVASPQGV